MDSLRLDALAQEYVQNEKRKLSMKTGGVWDSLLF